MSLTGSGALGVDAAPVAGLLVDGWTEGIPQPSVQTGIAIYIDSPSARAPQVVLLSVVDDGFSLGGLSDQLLDVVALAKLRAVGPADLPAIGQYLPTVLLPGATEISESPS